MASLALILSRPVKTTALILYLTEKKMRDFLYAFLCAIIMLRRVQVLDR